MTWSSVSLWFCCSFCSSTFSFCLEQVAIFWIGALLVSIYKLFQTCSPLSSWKGIGITAATLFIVEMLMYVLLLSTQQEQSTPEKQAASPKTSPNKEWTLIYSSHPWSGFFYFVVSINWTKKLQSYWPWYWKLVARMTTGLGLRLELWLELIIPLFPSFTGYFSMG